MQPEQLSNDGIIRSAIRKRIDPTYGYDVDNDKGLRELIEDDGRAIKKELMQEATREAAQEVSQETAPDKFADKPESLRNLLNANLKKATHHQFTELVNVYISAHLEPTEEEKYYLEMLAARAWYKYITKYRQNGLHKEELERMERTLKKLESRKDLHVDKEITTQEEADECEEAM